MTNNKDTDLIPYCLSALVPKKIAFTLAEVLITIGIIGVVAAITIPNLITAYQKRQVETKLKKFYSTINQTVRLSMAENGSPEGWFSDFTAGGSGYTYERQVEFLNTYILPYMKNHGYEKCMSDSKVPKPGVCVYLFDGGLMWFYVDRNGGDITYLIDNNWDNRSVNKRKKRFYFQFYKLKSSYDLNTLNSTSFVEPYIMNWDGTREQLLDGNTRSCKTDGVYCTKLIQLNNWKIPKDYPW